jgi:two-component system sensor histidine kinase UhpB
MWDTYGWYIAAATVAVGAQLVLLVSLIARLVRWRQAEVAIRSREKRLSEDFSRIRMLAGRLIKAQEEARAAIARDLHDDVCQELFGVTVAVSTAGRAPHGPQTDEAMSRLHGVVAKVRRIAHDLYPATLQLLGLAAALRAHCIDVQTRHDVQVDFHEGGHLEGITPDAALCLFRIAQEALRNGVVHGDARRFEVVLTRRREHIELVVSDDGCGFDIEAVRRSGTGMGLLSMEERAQMVGGHTEVDSGPGHGTRIRVRLPAEWGDRAEGIRAAGPLPGLPGASAVGRVRAQEAV